MTKEGLAATREGLTTEETKLLNRMNKAVDEALFGIGYAKEDEMTKAGERLIRSAKQAKSLVELLDEAQKRYEAMTPEQQEAMWKAQRESWARANISTGDPRWD